jgi:hypothetical protein
MMMIIIIIIIKFSFHFTKQPHLHRLYGVECEYDQNGEFEKKWKTMVVAYFMVLTQNLWEGTE